MVNLTTIPTNNFLPKIDTTVVHPYYKEDLSQEDKTTKRNSDQFQALITIIIDILLVITINH